MPELFTLIRRIFEIIWGTFVLGIAFLVVSVGLVFLSELLTGAPRELLAHFAVATMVAGALFVTLESLHKWREHLREERSEKQVEAIRNASVVALLHNLMDEKVFDEVRAQILSKPAVRREYVVEMVLERMPSPHQAYVSESLTLSYKMTNSTPSPITYEVVAWAENRNPQIKMSSVKQVKISSTKPFCVTLGKEVVDVVLRPKETKCEIVLGVDEMRQKNVYDDTSDPLAVSANIPVQLEPDQTIKVVLVYELIMAERDVDYISVVKPTDGLKITVRHPAGFVVRCNELHQAKASIGESKSDYHKTWSIERALLPYQGMLILWHPTPLELPPGRLADGGSEAVQAMVTRDE